MEIKEDHSMLSDKTILTSLLEEIREDRRRHPIKNKWFCFKIEIYLLLTENKLIRWIKKKFNEFKNNISKK
jgi:hypothetical protein